MYTETIVLPKICLWYLWIWILCRRGSHKFSPQLSYYHRPSWTFYVLVNCCGKIFCYKDNRVAEYKVIDKRNSLIIRVMICQLITQWVLDITQGTLLPSRRTHNEMITSFWRNNNVSITSSAVIWHWHILYTLLETDRRTSTGTRGLDDVFRPRRGFHPDELDFVRKFILCYQTYSSWMYPKCHCDVQSTI